MNTLKVIEQLESYKTHPMLAKRYQEIVKRKDLAWAHAFVKEHEALSLDAFAEKVTRLSLRADKPKSHSAIEELLICAVSAMR